MPEVPRDVLAQDLEERGLTPSQIDRVLYLYGLAVNTHGAGNWSQAQFQQWVDAQAQSFGAGRDRAQDEGFGAVQAIARETVRSRQRAEQRGPINNRRIDYGPALDPDVIANSLGAEAWVDAGGNYIDPATGQRTDEPVPADAASIWQAIKGQRFNMGSLAMPGAPQRVTSSGLTYTSTRHVPTITVHPSADTMERTGRRETRVIPKHVAPVKPRSFVTPSMALSLLSTMDEDYLIELQHQMFAAGMYPSESRPRWGVADVPTREAFKRLFVEASLTPDKTVAAVLADLMSDSLDASPQPDGAPGAGGIMSMFQPSVANSEQLRQEIDDIATETLGQHLSPQQRDALVSRLQSRDVELQRRQFMNEQSTRSSGGGGGGGQGQASLGEVDAFLQALSGQESGGNYGATNRGSGAHGKYQIMPGNWPEWSRRAGLGPNAPQTPANQEIVTRQIAMDYFHQFGNWRDVAVAWYSGPGRVARMRYNDAPQRGGPSINDYADEVMTRMNMYRRGAAPGATGGGYGEFGALEAFDYQSEAEAAVKAADPAGWQANEWSQRATQFFRALGSAVGAPG